mgnify:CR=1 FL=1
MMDFSKLLQTWQVKIISFMSEKTWLDEQVLQEMVYSVNREEVPADEILSDHPFRYEKEMNRLCMI